MPYIENNDEIFDLEIEKYKGNPKKFIQKIQNILQGIKHTDKYGNTIHLSTPLQKELFRSKIKQDPTLELFLTKDIINTL